MTREMYTYDVVIAPVNEVGRPDTPTEVVFQTFWSPHYEDILNEVANSAAATHTIKIKHKHIPISSTLRLETETKTEGEN